MPPKMRRQTCRELLHLLEIGFEHGAVDPLLAQIAEHLLDERQHRPERVVDVVRYAARQFGHRVPPLGRQQACLEGLGALQAGDGLGRLRAEAVHQIGVVAGQPPGVAGRHLEDAEHAVASDERCAEDRLLRAGRRARHR